MVFDGQSDAVTTQLDDLLGARHHRFQIELIGASDDLDDVSEENLAALQRLGRELVDGSAPANCVVSQLTPTETQPSSAARS